MRGAFCGETGAGAPPKLPRKQESRARLRSGRAAWLASLLALWPSLALAQTDASLNETQLLGRSLFNQSCRVCHTKPQLTSAVYGPVLLQESLGGQADVMREVIANGTPRMPGFKYHFEAAQIDAIVQYLKTVPKQP
jgi:mono/diheme cytochrome c family protein